MGNKIDSTGKIKAGTAGENHIPGEPVLPAPRSLEDWHYRHDEESRMFHNIFFGLCRKFNISYASATPEQRYFVEEVARIDYERDRARRFGLSMDSIRPAFEDGPEEACYHPGGDGVRNDDGGTKTSW